MIPISEQFLSFQGEGPYAGQRAVFLRTHACNLICGGGKYAKDAAWICDTIPVFTHIQKRVSPEDLMAEWTANGWLAALRSGVHLVLTGGEPLMDERQRELIPFLKSLPKGIFIEVETNGTILPIPEFDAHISHYTCSPKLSNSGMPRSQRLIPQVIRWHRNIARSVFKFVIAGAGDVQELITDLVNPFEIPSSKIWLMPAATTRTELLEYDPLVAKIAALHGWNFSSRLHILLYDRVTGM